MSGICGIVALSPLPGDRLRENLASMLAALAHLGPDGPARHLDAGAALGQLVDRQTPEAVGASFPVRGAGAERVIVADVRLDNRAELADSLGVDAAGLAALPDEALLLRAYERWGADCARHLLGDYSFAVWDAPERRLTLVRDALGVRPCFYVHGGAYFAFASELKGLLALAEVPTKLSDTRVADYLNLELDDLESTFYEDIRRLPPAHVLELTPRAHEKRRYWTLELGPELVLKDRHEYSAAFREILLDAVEKRLRTTQPVGFLLSGGLDSSSLVGIARSRGLTPIRTFSALFSDYPRIDEKPWMELVLAGGGCEPEFVRADRGSPLGNIERELRDQDEPFFAPNTFVDSLLLDRAQNSGVRVMLDGLDGDTTVGHGWELMGELLRRFRVRRLYRLARDFASHTDKSRFWFLWRHALGPTLFGLLRKAMGDWAVRSSPLLNPEFAARTNATERMRQAHAVRSAGPLSPFRAQHHAKLASGLLPACYEVAAKQAGSRGMVRRHPYFDRRLVEFCVSLPASERLDRGVDRLVQRRAVEGFVPEDIRRRLTKSIWVENAKDRLKTDDRRRLQDLGKSPQKKAVLEAFIDWKVLDKVRDRCLRGSASERDLTWIWLVTGLDVWLGERTGHT